MENVENENPLEGELNDEVTQNLLNKEENKEIKEANIENLSEVKVDKDECK